MKNLIIILLFPVLLFSCTTVEFETPQPKGEKSLSFFPDELIGKYILNITGSEGEIISDSTMITIYKNYISSINLTNKNEKDTYLSDSCLIFKYKDMYCFNFLEEDKSRWNVNLIEINFNNNLMVYSLYDVESDEKAFIDNINSITKVKIATNRGQNIYTINPSRKEFDKMVKENYFHIFYEFIRIEE